MDYNFNMSCKSYIFKINYTDKTPPKRTRSRKKYTFVKIIIFLHNINELNYFVLEIYINNRKRPHRRDG